MRRVLMLLSVAAGIVACAKTDTPAADTTQTDAAVAPAPPLAIAESDMAGTWKGTTTPVGSDSVVSRWTAVCGAGTCNGTSEGSPTKVVWNYTLAGDSAVAVSKPYADPSAKGAQVIDSWVSRVQGDNVSGTGVTKLASNPDSVVLRYTFAGTRSR